MEEQKKLTEEQNKKELLKWASDLGVFVIVSDGDEVKK